MSSTEAMNALRLQIQALEGGGACRKVRIPSFVPCVDAAIDGLPKPGIVEISGKEGTGRTRLALALAAAFTKRDRPVAWVDTLRRLYPPSAAKHGVVMERLVVVRPPRDRPENWAWATEQLLRSGCFSLVICDLPKLGRRKGRLQAWARSAEHGDATLVVVSNSPVRTLPAEIRLSVGTDSFYVLRDRGGVAGSEGNLPLLTERACPWGAV